MFVKHRVKQSSAFIIQKSTSFVKKNESLLKFTYEIVGRNLKYINKLKKRFQ